jgi:tetratricopeptide (TPR) repeat protein
MCFNRGLRDPRVILSRHNSDWRLRAGLALLALVCYANTFTLGLALDASTLLRDPRVHTATAQNLGLIFKYDYWWPSSVDQLYRPLTTASFLFNYAVLGNGDHGAGYHVLNVLLHVLNVLLVFELARRLLRSIEPAAAAAAIWAVHPIATEVVANVAGRADLLSTACVVGGLLLYTRQPVNPFALFVAALAAVFSKENGAVLIGLMLLWDVAIGAPKQRRLAAYGAASAALLIMAVVRWQVFAGAPWPEMPFGDNPLRLADFLSVRLTAIKVIGLELGLLVWPLGQAYDHSYNQIPISRLEDAGPWIALSVIVALVVVAAMRRRRDPVLFWSAGFFGITLLPSSNLVMIIGSIMAERFLYLPSVAFAVAAAALAYRARPQVARAIIASAVVLLAACTVARNRAWESNLSLAAADVTTAPRSFRVHQMLGDALFQSDPRRNIDAAIHEEEVAWSIVSALPNDRIQQQVPASLGLYYRVKGDASPADRRAWYEKSLGVLERARDVSRTTERAYDAAQLTHGRPLTARVANRALYLYLGTTYQRLGRPADAVEAYRYGRELDPGMPEMYDALSSAYRDTGNLEWAAIAMDQKALVLGLNPPTVAALKALYGDNSCAIQGDQLNLGCARVLSDMCKAWADLSAVFHAARLPEQSRAFQEAAVQNGCR